MIEMMQAGILTAIEIICCKIFTEIFLKPRIAKYKNINFIIIIIFIFLSTLIGWIQTENYYFKSIMVLGVLALFIWVYFEASAMQILFCAGGYYGILMTIDQIMMWIVSVFIQNTYTEIIGDIFKITVMAMLCKTVLFLCVIILNRWLKIDSSFHSISELEWLKFLFFPIFTLISMLLMLMNSNKYEEIFIFISAGLIGGNFFVLYMVKNIICREESMREMLLDNEKAKNQTDMYYQMIKYYDKQRKQIHEFKNHIGCIQGLLEASETQRALNYIGKINSSRVDEIDYIFTKHAVINAVLNQKYKQAKIKDIPIIFRLDNMEKLTIQDEDIVTLLANLLNNAIEAVEQIKEGDRAIKFAMTHENNCLVICIRNPIPRAIERIKGRLETTKSEPEKHGIGMVNINKVVKDYKGEYIYSINQGYFTSTIIINNI